MPRFEPTTGKLAILRRAWFDASRTVYQDCSASVDGHCRVILSDGTVLDPHADAPSVAGGGGVAAWENSLDLAVHDSLGRVWPGAAIAAVDSVGPDGAYALKVLRNSYGPWDVIERDGSRWRLTNGDAHDVQLLGNRQAVWMIGDQHFTTPGLPLEMPTELTWGGRVARIGDHFVFVYQRRSDGALVCDGHVIAMPSDRYYYFDVEYRDGRVRITWSPSQADTDPQLLTFTLAELAALPLSAAVPVPAPAPPAPSPSPAPKPVPPPEPTPVSIPNQLSTVQSLRAKYPTPLGAQHAAFLAEVALATGMGLLRKSGGTTVTMPDGVTVSQDILMDRASSRIFDILGDAEGAAVPSWGEAGGSPVDSSRFYAVSAPPTPAPGPVTPPSPSTTPGAQLDAQVAALSAQVANLVNIVGRQVAQIQGLQDQVTAVRNSPAAGPVSLDGVRVALKADNGKYVCADFAQAGTFFGQVPLLVNRDDAGSWETFTLETK